MTPEDIAKLPYRRNVGVMMINSDGAVFVGQRADRYKDAWQMPQGGIDEGEDPRTAALRELEEETGVLPSLVEIIAESEGWLPYDLPHDVVPSFWGGRYRGQEQKWYLMRFLGSDDQVRIDTEHPEFSAWCWQPVEHLVEKIVPFKREVYARVVEEFERYL
ncbi:MULTISPECIES: RNA pyrophosphohydrolase [Rhodobacterales]|jgi:putative (di)nucleoside polyphosphate hydrolase|uniref:RNA pyrophosphohydrolase n=1 Tax=Rhodobacterales TaxID=204455 RepID=UPI00237F3731|nr:RNA pyrophosphohydrolase [Phaeobacter gallaeciensis]MEC9310603.1 RNA pyrophosphohydrolase [Pseudomonadota bacterium]MDE4097498.1 RNA pyrophosphohydrolase [Phaeobacter gallaeciensis]MDE4105988.1 RNA pyrophosphohydrolase [Phaeobacter gallaeciensis]MDE4110762.1 RNA pyrophosphohydrolase [Phaeobacter gallaeciensis]MDE4115233.1 RNA pyrophosphohydrolase [Phaeobacter gallaeciensis]